MTLAKEVIRRKDSIVAAGRARFTPQAFTQNTGIPVPEDLQAPGSSLDEIEQWVRDQVRITMLGGFVSKEDEIVEELVGRIN